MFGRDVVDAPGKKVIGDAGADKTIFMWAFQWWPHAIGHGHDPFNANVVWMPHGIDLAWATTVPLLSIVLFPVTAAAGAIAAYNLAALAAPAFSAWTAYLLSRYLTRAFWPSVAAGWLFGFAAYEVGQLVAHLNLAFVAFLPLVALAGLKHLRGALSNVNFVILLGLALTAQFLTSTELYADALLVGATAVIAGLVLVPDLRPRLRATALFGAAATALSLLLVSPYLWHAFVTAGVKSAPLRAPFTESADVLNYVVPTHRIWLQLPGSSRVAHHFSATGAERGAYLGVPLAIIVVIFLWQHRRSRTSWAVAVTLFAVLVASFGARVRVNGHVTVPAPWRIFATLPITKTILPIRFTVFVALIVALIVAAWLAETPRSELWLRWGLAALAIIFVLPNPANRLWSTVAPNPTFFRTAAYKSAISRGATVLVLPFGGAGWSLLWQAEDGFRYRLIGGHLGRLVTPQEERWKDVYLALRKGSTGPQVQSRFRAFLSTHRVGELVAAAETKPRVRVLVTSIGTTATRVADVTIYRVP
jgi:hypothetical protein